MRIPRPLIAIATVAAVAAIAVGCDDDDASDRIAAVCDAQEGVAAAVSNLQAFDPTTDSAGDLDDARNDVEDAVDDRRSARHLEKIHGRPPLGKGVSDPHRIGPDTHRIRGHIGKGQEVGKLAQDLGFVRDPKRPRGLDGPGQRRPG